MIDRIIAYIRPSRKFSGQFFSFFAMKPPFWKNIPDDCLRFCPFTIEQISHIIYCVRVLRIPAFRPMYKEVPTVEYTLSGDVLTVFPIGTVTSANADDYEAEISGILAKQPYKALVMDAEGLQYSTSAGLRVILRLLKKNPDFKIINVNSELYEVFDMTGFTQMMSIEKAFRKFDVTGCEVIGEGSNGVVYRIDPDTIIKVFRNPDSLPDIRNEQSLARKAFVMGIPTAISFDVVRVGNSYGAVYEMLNAESLCAVLRRDPGQLDSCVDISVELLKKIHATELKPGEMPDQKQVALDWVRFLKGHLPERVYEKIYALVESVPEDHHMLHGDYHVKNIMVQNGETLLIDMDTLCLGHPVFEFASIYLAYKGFHAVDSTNCERFMGLPYETCSRFWDKTLERYFGTDDPEKLREIENKAKLMGNIRLLRRTIRRESDTEAGQKLIAYCRDTIIDLADRVDTLVF